jgi:phosphate transport system protein
MTHEHIVKSFDEELKRLTQVIMRMGGLAERQLARSVEALARRDTELARSVIDGDEDIDKLEVELEDMAVKMIALRQPMANDLRAAVAVLKISSDLERIGDYAKNIAKRAVTLNQLPALSSTVALRRMAQLAGMIIKETLDAYSLQDSERALAAWERDREVDELYTSLFREHLTYMMEDPRNITTSTHIIFIAKNIERIGDHATNIAETIYFLATGSRIEGERPKKDKTSFTVVEPGEGPEKAGSD